MTTYDLLIPIDLPEEAGFVGQSWRRSGGGLIGVNHEMGFTFGDMEASFHRLEARAYIILRLAKAVDAMEAMLPRLRGMIARASVMLDISIRPTFAPIRVLASGQIADLVELSVFPAGEMPRVKFGDGHFSLQVPVGMLSDALGNAGDVEGLSEAFRIFSDVDFEATVSGRFVLLATILELLAERRPRDPEALEFLERWKAEARNGDRSDLAQVLDHMKQESIGTAIAALVDDAARRAGCTEQETTEFRIRARDAYRKRSRLLHAGVSITTEELGSLRSIVRMVLAGSTSRAPFTPIGTKAWSV